MWKPIKKEREKSPIQNKKETKRKPHSKENQHKRQTDLSECTEGRFGTKPISQPGKTELTALTAWDQVHLLSLKSGSH